MKGSLILYMTHFQKQELEINTAVNISAGIYERLIGFILSDTVRVMS